MATKNVFTRFGYLPVGSTVALNVWVGTVSPEGKIVGKRLNVGQPTTYKFSRRRPWDLIETATGKVVAS